MAFPRSFVLAFLVSGIGLSPASEDFLGGENGYFCADLFLQNASNEERIAIAYFRALESYREHVPAEVFAAALESAVKSGKYYEVPAGPTGSLAARDFIEKVGISMGGNPSFEERIRKSVVKLADEVREGVRTAESAVEKAAKLPELKKVMRSHTQPIGDLYPSADFKKALSASHDHSIVLWDLETGLPLHVMSDHTDRVTSVRANSDFTKAVSGSEDGSIIVWDLKTGKKLRTLSAKSEPFGKTVSSVSVDSEFKQVIGVSAYAIILWDIESGEEIRRLTASGGNYFWKAEANEDLTRMVSSNSTGDLVIWNPQTGAALPAMEDHPVGDVQVLTVDPTFSRAASVEKDGTMIVWDVKTGSLIRTYPSQGETIDQVRISRDLKHAVTSNFQNLYLWDLETGEVIQKIPRDDRFGQFVEFTPDLKWGASTTRDGEVRVRNLFTRKRLYTLGKSPGGKPVMILRFSPDGKQILNGASDYSVVLWDLDRLERLE